MIYSNLENLEDKIIKLLNHQKSCSAKEIGNLLAKSGNSYSFQGVYKTLKQLLKSEVLLKSNKLYFINEEWRENIVKNFSNIFYAEIADGEKVKYELETLVHHDIQWKNIVLPLHKQFPTDPIFFYNYHYIWIFLNELRKQSELQYCKSFLKNKTYAFFLIGSNATQNKEIKKLFRMTISK